jgi:hypothetical protein
VTGAVALPRGATGVVGSVPEVVAPTLAKLEAELDAAP